MAQINQNLTDYNVSRILPPGWYAATIINSEIKQGPKGAYIQWTYEMAENHAWVRDIHSLGNEVGLRKLKTLATHAGHKNPNYLADTEELHGKKLELKLKIEASEEYGDKNTVVDYRPIKGATSEGAIVFPQSDMIPPHIVQAAMSQSGNNGQEKTKMPWEK